ncbi:LysR family transcriptional regulator [Leisingera sp. ANG-M1]|uniref:LysR family transcriptional regulator n=1 Tax=Leisingera sp. ANG-M1 TaxID=1577895 RepID=UPI00057DDA0B|nr:LysR family transcriptional regulator [Leisingera sp. ANG-M1]KIC08832.1 LysR family transcriptional regulator [Leisingera sp. ANG-M1]
MNRSDISGLEVFLAIAKAGSLRAAAVALGVNPPAVSHQLKAFETRLGVALFDRNTRSVQLTEAGRVLRERCRHVTETFDDALEEVRQIGKSRVGTLRLTLPYRAWQLVILPRLAAFQETHPGIRLDFSIDEGLVDIISQGFHAGIRLEDRLQPDMVGRRLTGPLAAALVACPFFLKKHGTPQTPADLHRFRCIGYRGPQSGQIMPWSFKGPDGEFTLDPTGALIVDDMRTAVEAAAMGLGITWSLRDGVEPLLKNGALREILPGYSRKRPGFHLYYSRHIRNMELLRLFSDHFS